MKQWLALRSIAGIVVMIAFISLLTACDNGPVPSTPVPNTGDSTPTANSSGVIPYKTPLMVNDWTLLTNGFKRYQFLPLTKDSGTDLKPVNGTFGVILLNATNRGGADTKLDLSSFQLTDDSGHTFVPDVHATQQYSGEKGSLAKVDQPIAPGATAQVGIVFDLPATTYTFVFHALGGAMDPGAFPAK